jgi:hypothetical protein
VSDCELLSHIHPGEEVWSWQDGSIRILSNELPKVAVHLRIKGMGYHIVVVKIVRYFFLKIQT